MNIQANKNGFTIVELLIVVVVIAILAAITIVAYNGITNNTHDSTVQSDLRNVGTQVNKVYAETGSYPIPASTSTVPVGMQNVKISKGSYHTPSTNFYYCVSRISEKFAVIGRSKSGKTWVNYSDSGVREYTGTWSVSGDICPATLNVVSTANYTFSYGQTASGAWFAWVE